MNKQIAAAMAVFAAVFLVATCIGVSAEDADAADPVSFTVGYDKYSITVTVSEPVGENTNGTAFIQKVTVDEGATNVAVDLPETVTYDDNGTELTYSITGIGLKGNAMVVFSTADGAANIKSISIPDTYTWLTSSAFINCSNLESVKLSSSLESIEEQTFKGTKIASIDIPEGIETIGVGAFQNCANLTTVSIPSTVTTIGQDAFRYTGLTTVTIAANSDTGIERSIGKNAFTANSSLSEISIPEGFTKISDYAFQNCKALTDVTVPSTVKELWNNAFDGCSSLESVSFEGETKFTGTTIFKNCTALESVELHEGMSGHTGYQFSGCTSLKEVEIPEGFEKIEMSMFSGCTSLTSVTIPDSVKTIDDEAFSGCSALSTVTFTGTEPPTIPAGTFDTGIEFIVPEGSEDAYQRILDAASGGDASVNDYVAQVGSDKYTTLDKALEAAVSGDTVTLLADITESITIPSGKDIVLDLGTYTLTNTADQHTITVESGATLTIKGTGTVDNISNGKAAVLNYGTFTLESGKLTRSVQTDSNTYYVLKNDGTANVKGGEIVADTGSSSLICNGGTSTATMTVTGGTIEQKSMGIALKNDEFGTLKIAGGTIIGAGQALQNWNDADITGGSLDGDVTTWNYVKNGLSTKSSTSIGGDARVSGDIYSMKYVENTDDYTLEGIEDPEVLITGGEIDGTISTGVADLVEDHDWKDLVGDEYDWVDVSGGKFTREVDDRFLAPGVTMAQNPDGTYGVGEGVHVTFVHEDGTTLGEFDIVKGMTIPAEKYPVHPKEHYGYEFTDGDGHIWNPQTTVDDDLTLFATPYIVNLKVTATIENGVATAVIDTPVEYVDVMYAWYYNQNETPIGATGTVTLGDDGAYMLAVAIADADGVYGIASYEFEYTAESQLPPFIPFPPEQGGDPVEVYPSGDGDSSSDDGDGSMKVVAVAAAAVIAAILTIVLASTYRKD